MVVRIFKRCWLQRPIVDSARWLSIAGGNAVNLSANKFNNDDNNSSQNLLLSHNVANNPSLQSILHRFALNFHAEGSEFFRLNRSMQSQLHGDLHHQSTKHEGSVGPLARRRKGPSAKNTQGLDHMVILRHTRDSRPEEPTEGPRE